MANGYYSEKNRRRIIYEKAKRRKQALRIKRIFILSVCMLFAIFILAFIVNKVINNSSEKVAKVGPVSVLEDFLEPNIYSRPQKPLKKVKGIVIHYTANPGSDALANRNYFNNLPSMNESSGNPVYASSHYIIGLDGTIVQCIPLDEIAYASNERNKDTISIECCHPDETGKFTDATYDSLIRLTAWLCGQYNVSGDNIIRHYDVTGKECPRYYVKHKKKWDELKNDVMKYISENAL
mgnify:CR=1 FL=1